MAISQYLKDRRARAWAYVNAIRARTYCKRCGKQPIEFHNEEHIQRPHRRINKMVSNANYSLETIQAEIDQCEALCRSCHMKEDGRLFNLNGLIKFGKQKTN